MHMLRARQGSFLFQRIREYFFVIDLHPLLSWRKISLGNQQNSLTQKADWKLTSFLQDRHLLYWETWELCLQCSFNYNSGNSVNSVVSEQLLVYAFLLQILG